MGSSHTSLEAAALRLSTIQSDERLGSAHATTTFRLLAGQGGLSRPAAHPQNDRSRSSAWPRHRGRLGGQVQWASAQIDPRRLGRSQADGAWPRSAKSSPIAFAQRSICCARSAGSRSDFTSRRTAVVVFCGCGFRLRHGRSLPCSLSSAGRQDTRARHQGRRRQAEGGPGREAEAVVDRWKPGAWPPAATCGRQLRRPIPSLPSGVAAVVVVAERTQIAARASCRSSGWSQPDRPNRSKRSPFA